MSYPERRRNVYDDLYGRKPPEPVDPAIKEKQELSRRQAYVTGVYMFMSGVALAVNCIVFFLVGVWQDSGKWAATGGILLAPTFVLLIIGAILADANSENRD